MIEIQTTEQGWLIQIPDEMVSLMGVARSSVGVLHPTPGALNVEILPPPAPALHESVLQGCAELHEAFTELQRRGD